MYRPEQMVLVETGEKSELKIVGFMCTLAHCQAYLLKLQHKSFSDVFVTEMIVVKFVFVFPLLSFAWHPPAAYLSPSLHSSVICHFIHFWCFPPSPFYFFLYPSIIFDLPPPHIFFSLTFFFPLFIFTPLSIHPPQV